jgi:hypothetical protein
MTKRRRLLAFTAAVPLGSAVTPKSRFARYLVSCFFPRCVLAGGFLGMRRSADGTKSSGNG